MSDALETLYESLQSRLNNASALWDDRAYPDFIPGDNPRPSIVYAHIGGGDEKNVRKSDPIYLIQVMIITSNQNAGQNAAVDARVGAGLISDLVNNQGSQGVGEDGLPTARAMTGDANWVIKTITKGTRLDVVDNWTKNGVAVYHSGHEFTVTMEALT